MAYGSGTQVTTGVVVAIVFGVVLLSLMLSLLIISFTGIPGVMQPAVSTNFTFFDLAR